MLQPLLIIQHISHEEPGLLSGLLEEYATPFETVDLSRGERYPDPCSYSAVITLGGPQSANDNTSVMLGELRNIEMILHNNIPYLGICLGMQTLVKAAGGEVRACPIKETGFFAPDGQPYTVELTEKGRHDPLFNGLDKNLRVFQLHGETVTLNGTTALLATGKSCKNQIVKVGSCAYGIQSHFELTEQLFFSWLSTDNDLRVMDRRKLVENFREIQPEYEKTGNTLLKNFLGIAGII